MRNKFNLEIELYKGNILNIDCDAVVNAANEHLLAGGGVCGAIFAAAGLDELQNACNKIGYCPTGSAVITAGFKLKQKYIIHAVGPIYNGDRSSVYLKQVYLSVLKLADQYKLNSIAIPSISTGIYGYPKKEAAGIAIDVIDEYKPKYLKNIYLACYDDETYNIYKNLMEKGRI